MYIISRIICKKKKKPYKDRQTNQTGLLKIIQRKAEKENREITRQELVDLAISLFRFMNFALRILEIF